MIDVQDQSLSLSLQCKLLGISRSQIYYRKQPERKQDVQEKYLLGELFLTYPFYGYRKMACELRSHGHQTTTKRVRRLMRELGLRGLTPKKYTSRPKKEHPVYPYLLKGKRIRYPNQVWATDITYLKVGTGYVYLVAIMDLFSRKVLSWKISVTMDAEFCTSAVKEAFALHGIPAILNTDQGSQFTSYGFVKALTDAGVRISMDSQGRWRDNIYVERLWRSLKYEDIYLKSYEKLRDLKHGVSKYFMFYNRKRFHQHLDYQTPDEMYRSFNPEVSGEAA